MTAPAGMVIQPCLTTGSRASAGLVSSNRLLLDTGPHELFEEKESRANIPFQS